VPEFAENAQQKTKKLQTQETLMGRNLDFDNCTTEAVLAAYEQELNENERRICDEGAWAISLDMSRIMYWYPILMRYCPNHPHTRDLKWDRELYKGRKDLAGFFFSWD
jgi:hypothetical protein